MNLTTIIQINLFLFSCCTMMSQNIIGSYTLSDPMLAVSDRGIIYNFKESGKFDRIIYEHLDRKIISGGVFYIVSDTLTLNYMSQGTNLQSNAKVISKDELADQENLASNIIVFNSKGKPQPGVNLLLQNKDKKLVTGFSSDEEGKFPPVSIHDPYIQYLTFSFLSHKEFSISTDTLFGYSTKIEVHLRDSNTTFNNTDKVVKYIITNRTKDGFQLQPQNGNHNSTISMKKSP